MRVGELLSLLIPARQQTRSFGSRLLFGRRILQRGLQCKAAKQQKVTLKLFMIFLLLQSFARKARRWAHGCVGEEGQPAVAVAPYGCWSGRVRSIEGAGCALG